MTESITFTITPSEPFGIFANPRVSADALHARLVEQGRLSLLEGEADKALRGSPTLDDSLARAARLIYLLIEQHSRTHGIHDAGFAVAWAVAFIEDARRPTPADVAVFVDRLVWGWAVVDQDEGVEALLATADAAAGYLAETDERDNLADVVPMMFFDGEDEYPGIVLAEDELAALGPCPGLRTAEKVMNRRRVFERMREHRADEWINATDPIVDTWIGRNVELVAPGISTWRGKLERVAIHAITVGGQVGDRDHWQIRLDTLGSAP